MKKRILIILLIVMISVTSNIFAVPANPTPFDLEQPDGSKFKAIQVGDERNAWIETLDGYTITQNLQGQWVYATEGKLSESEIKEIQKSKKFKGLSGTNILKPTNKIVGRDLPKGLKKNIRPDLQENTQPEKSSPIHQIDKSSGFPQYSPGTTGNEYIVVIPIQFTDVSFSSGHDQLYYQNLIFSENNTGSMNSYFKEISYGLLNVTGVIAPVVTSSHTMSYYGADGPPSMCGGRNIDSRNGCIYEIAREAVQLANPSIDFSLYDKDSNGVVDQVMIVHAGNGQESSASTNDIWSHAWYIDACSDPGGVSCGEQVDGVEVEEYTLLAENSPIGTFAHEFAHALGLPDLYNTQTGMVVVGRWELMDQGSWNNNGNTPAHLSSWSKSQLDWLTPINVVGLNITNIDQLETNQEAFRLEDNWLSAENEYFLVENRQLTGFDSYLPRSGILIWHIDDKQTNNNGIIKMVMPELAGGNLSAATFASNYGLTSFNSISTPNSDTNAGDETAVYAVDIGSSGSSMAAKLFAGVSKLEPYLITGNKDVPQNKFFTFKSGIRCSGVACGNISATLDPETEIYYDDGTATTYYTDSNFIWAVRFTSPFYPLTITQAKVMFYDPYSVGNYSATVHVYDDNNGVPGNELITPFSTVIGTFYPSWKLIPLDTPIMSGDFWIGITAAGGSLGPYALADGSTTTQRSVGGDGSIWYSLNKDLMLRAFVEEGFEGYKGVIPMNNGTPFYTISNNPQNKSNLICLQNMQAGDTCNQTWIINATGDINTSYYFFTKYSSNLFEIEDQLTPYVNVTITNESTFSITLLEGWNLISFPLNFTNITEIFDPIQPYFISMFSYDEKLKKFIEIDPFNNNEEFNLKNGVWLKVSENVILSISGKEFENKDIPLVQGWNLVGHSYLEDKNVGDLFANDTVYSYTNSWSSYISNRSFNSLQTLKPGYGYWVKSE